MRRSRKFSLAGVSSAAWKHRNSLLPLQESENDTEATPAPQSDDPAVVTEVDTMLDSINAAGASTETAEANPEHEIKHEEGDAMEEDAGARQHKYLEEDLIAEHFGFVPMEFMDEVFCAMSQIATEAMNEFEEFVKGELEDEEAVDKGMAKLETLIDNAIDWCFDKCEVYVTRNIFKFPSDVGVTLPHYRALNLTLTEKDELDLDRTIAETRQKLVAAKYINRRMRKEIELLDTEIPILRQLQDSVDCALGTTPMETLEAFPSTLSELEVGLRYMRAASASVIELAKSASTSEVVAKSNVKLRGLTDLISGYLNRRTGGMEIVTTDAAHSLSPTTSKEEIAEAMEIGPVPDVLSQ